jgi:ribosome-associated toxin RatA of RatAB toxin-antitoxin module
MATVQESIEVDVPVSKAYNQWTQFEDFPRFMSGVDSVRQLDDTTVHFETSIGGVKREYDAQITVQEPDQRVTWESLNEPRNAGTVWFEALGPEQTKVNVELTWEPDSAMEKIGAAVGLDSRQVASDLKKFKEFIESQGSETGAWRETVRDGEVAGQGGTAGMGGTGTTGMAGTADMAGAGGTGAAGTTGMGTAGMGTAGAGAAGLVPPGGAGGAGTGMTGTGTTSGGTAAAGTTGGGMAGAGTGAGTAQAGEGNRVGEGIATPGAGADPADGYGNADGYSNADAATGYAAGPGSDVTPGRTYESGGAYDTAATERPVEADPDMAVDAPYGDTEAGEPRNDTRLGGTRRDDAPDR